MSRTYRVGLIVPSSNVTMETEIPALFRRREALAPERFTFHSSRARMRTVSAEELARMVEASDECAAELADARCDVPRETQMYCHSARGVGTPADEASRDPQDAACSLA